MIQFDRDEIFHALLDLIKLPDEEDASQKHELALLSEGRLRFDIKTGKKEFIDFDREMSAWSARFQINRKLYVCGGRAMIN